MTDGADVPYAVIARRRLARWHISVPGVGRTTTLRRSRVESAARALIAHQTGKSDVQVVVLSKPAPGHGDAAPSN